MGCDYSLLAKRKFSERLSELKGQIDDLKKQKSILESIGKKLGEEETQGMSMKDFHFEISIRLEQLETVIESIQTQREADFQECIAENSLDNGNFTITESVNFDQTSKDKMESVTEKSILEDPVVKAMIESKRRRLEQINKNI